MRQNTVKRKQPALLQKELFESIVTLQETIIINKLNTSQQKGLIAKNAFVPKLLINDSFKDSQRRAH